MATFLLSVVVVLLAVAGLAVGRVLGRPPLRGSCGGLGCEGACSTCPKRRDP